MRGWASEVVRRRGVLGNHILPISLLSVFFGFCSLWPHLAHLGPTLGSRLLIQRKSIRNPSEIQRKSTGNPHGNRWKRRRSPARGVGSWLICTCSTQVFWATSFSPALQEGFFKGPALYKQTPDQPQSGRYVKCLSDANSD